MNHTDELEKIVEHLLHVVVYKKPFGREAVRAEISSSLTRAFQLGVEASEKKASEESEELSCKLNCDKCDEMML